MNLASELMFTALTKDSKVKLQERLLDWFEREGRDFSWRSQTNPYAVLIAEKLLQQTAARDIVVEVYDNLLRTYPTPWLLAAANISDLEDIIRPLGLGYRAKELHTMANELVTYHNGEVPRDLKKLVALSGIGEYAARAVLSFAFGEDVPVVDTNVSRFLYRMYGLKCPMPSNPARKKDLVKLAGTLIPKGHSKKFNLAILDLCAQICKPINPACLECPIHLYCSHGLKEVNHAYERASANNSVSSLGKRHTPSEPT